MGCTERTNSTGGCSYNLTECRGGAFRERRLAGRGGCLGVRSPGGDPLRGGPALGSRTQVWLKFWKRFQKFFGGTLLYTTEKSPLFKGKFAPKRP